MRLATFHCWFNNWRGCQHWNKPAMANNRERKMHTNFFCTHFLNTPGGPGHPGKISGTSQIPLFETQGRQTFKGGHKLFDHHPFAWKTPTPTGGLRTQKVNLCALFSCLKQEIQDVITAWTSIRVWPLAARIQCCPSRDECLFFGKKGSFWQCPFTLSLGSHGRMLHWTDTAWQWVGFLSLGTLALHDGDD